MQTVFLPRHVRETGDQPHPLANDEQTRAFLASIVESSDDSIIGTDLKGTILSWNRGAERLWGYTAEEMVGSHITTLFPADQRDDYLVTLDRILRQERIERFESTRVCKDGTILNVAAILSPIRDDRGRLLGVSAIYSDITEQKRSEAELLKAKDDAEAASRAKSEFLANMSHEIRTPMNGILGMLEVSLDMELPDELRDYLETAHTSANALLVILNDILDFSKIEAGRMELERTPFSVSATVYEAIESLAVMARHKGLEIRQEHSELLPAVLVGDPTRLRQVLINLINNAIKFTGRGSVEVRTSLESMNAEEAVVRFSVADTGIGMSTQQKNVIFEAFRQADGSTTRRYGGTGLGLSICQRLVHLMGGQLSVESTPGLGSTFSFEVRLSLPAAGSVRS